MIGTQDPKVGLMNIEEVPPNVGADEVLGTEDVLRIAEGA